MNMKIHFTNLKIHSTAWSKIKFLRDGLKKVLHRNGSAIGSMNYCDRVLLQRKAPEMRVISVK